MPRKKPDEAVKQRMWAALSTAAKRYHNQDVDRGIVTRIAEDAGVSKAAVSDWKNGGNYPEESTLRKLASLYSVSAEALSGYPTTVNIDDYFGPPDELMRRSVDIAEQVVNRLLPDASRSQVIEVVRRANALILEGYSDAEVRGHLFDELTREDFEAE